MNESILNTVKKLIGLDTEYTQFDADIIIHINSALSVLRQIGVGPEEGFKIQSAAETWDQFMTDTSLYEEVKDYIFLRVKLLFDDLPTNTMTAIKEQLAEFEWRLATTAELTKN